jgi:hypothetical protein
MVLLSPKEDRATTGHSPPRLRVCSGCRRVRQNALGGQLAVWRLRLRVGSGCRRVRQNELGVRQFAVWRLRLRLGSQGVGAFARTRWGWGSSQSGDCAYGWAQGVGAFARTSWG